MVDALLERHVGVGAGGHRWRDGDLAWLGLLLSLVSALLVVGLVWWLVG